MISAATAVEREDGAKTPDRWTVVPACIDHRTRALAEAGAAAAAAAVRELHEAAGGGGEDDAGKGALVFVSSRSTHLGGAHAVAKVTHCTLSRVQPQHPLQPSQARLRLP